MTKRTGLTLLELLLALTFTALLATAMSFAYGSAFKASGRLSAAIEPNLQQVQIQQKITQFIQHAYLSSTTTDPNTYFTTNPISNPPTTSGTNTSISAGSQSSTSSSGSSSLSQYGGSQELVLTAIGLPIPAAYIHSSDDFQTLNQDFGPSSGLAEISLSLNAAGSANNQTGLFLRVQQPADSDPTQGGVESLLIPNCTDVSFQFFDGTQWDPTWDTVSQTTKQLPSAVKVTYSINNGDPITFVVPVYTSNVTPQNPVTQTGSSQ